jgi:hypothetical protein
MKRIAAAITGFGLCLASGCGQPPPVPPPSTPLPRAIANQPAIPSPEEAPEVQADAPTEEEQLYKQWIAAINDTATALGKGDESQAEALQKKQAALAQQIEQLSTDRQKALAEKFSQEIKQARDRETKAATGEPLN